MDITNVGLLGFGTVGTGVAKILLEQETRNSTWLGHKVALRKIVDTDIDSDRGIALPAGILSTQAGDVLDNPDIDIVVEAIGGINPARGFILAALKNGKHVVTSNKEVIAKHGAEIYEMAKEKGENVFFEAAVGGGIPILRPLNVCLAANKIENITGIINGTTNYILSKMTKEGQAFDDVLQEAQAAGFAEADPTGDIEGFDAQYKAKILAALAYGWDIPLEAIYREGITKVTAADIRYAAEFNYVIKLLAIVKDTARGPDVRVHPVMLPADHALASVNEAFNAIFVYGNNVGETMFYGQGAGMMPTASAVVADVFDLALDGAYRMRSMVNPQQAPLPIQEVESCYYLRLKVTDEPGVLARISTILGNHRVSLTTVLQKDVQENVAVLIMITNLVLEKELQAAVKEVENLNSVKAIASLIRVGV